MVKFCSSLSCTNKGTKGFFSFPKDENLRNKWLDAVGLNSVSDRSFLCKNHFESDAFIHPPSLGAVTGVELKVKITNNAVPTLNLRVSTTVTDYDFGPLKTKRQRYGAYEKRERKDIVETLLAEHDEKDEPLALPLDHHQQQCAYPFVHYIISEDLVDSVNNTTSRATQTIESSFLPPLVKNRGTQVKPEVKEVGVAANPEVKTSLTGPDFPIQTDSSQQFPDPNDKLSTPKYEDCPSESDDEDEMDCTDPDWEPTLSDTDDDDSDGDTLDMTEDDGIWNEEDNGFIKEEKYIVFGSSLRQLFLLCIVCGSLCSSVTKKVIGSMLIVKSVCVNGHVKSWFSQPVANNTPLGNLLSAGAVMFSGASPTKALNIFKFLNIKMVSTRTYSRMQRIFLIPTISKVWERTQTNILKSVQGKCVKVGGDARCCSPGHSAKFGSYSFMDMETGLVLAVELVQSNEVKNSNAMELEGLKRVMTKMKNHDVDITDIITDRHLQVRKYLREEHPQTNHWFDGWHLAKSELKKLGALGKKKGCEAVSEWANSISNHMYFCAASSNGDGDQVQQKWTSILNHVTNKHEGHGDKFPRCLHAPIERNWILSGSKPHKELQLLLCNKRLMGDIRKLSPDEQTSQLEAQHKVVCQFAPKFVSFSYAGMKQRLNLAALHTCCNANRQQATTKDGSPRYSISYPKYKSGHVVRVVKEQCSYDYVDELLEEVVNLRKKYNSYRAAEAAALGYHASPPPLSSAATRVSKESACLRRRSRFSSSSST